MSGGFDLERATPILFGAGRALTLADELARRLPGTARALVVCDRALAGSEPVVAILGRLAEGGVRTVTFAEIAGDPKADQVDAAAAAARELQAQAVIGIGGGSALDTAKLAAASAPGRASVSAYALCAQPFPGGALPVLALPSTAGTGAEVTRTAIFTDRNGHKVWAWGGELLPALAVLDPVLSVSLPAKLTAWTGLDALVHAIEAATNRRANAANSASALQAIRLVAAHLERAVAYPDDLEARGGMLIAAALAGLAIDGTGTGVGHAIGHALGSMGPVHHGRAVALALSAALERNLWAAPALHEAVAIAMGSTPTNLVADYDALLDRVGVGRDLRDAGLGPDRTLELVALTQAAENRPMLQANAHAFDADELLAAARRVLGAA